MPILANMFWPLLYESASNPGIFLISIAVGLMAEWPAVVAMMPDDRSGALPVTVLANGVSTAVGWAISGVILGLVREGLVRLISGRQVTGEQLLTGVSLLIGSVFFNVLIESVVIWKVSRAKPSVRSLLWFSVANLASSMIMVAGAMVPSTPD